MSAAERDWTYICRSDERTHFPDEEQGLQCVLYGGYTVSIAWWDRSLHDESGIPDHVLEYAAKQVGVDPEEYREVIVEETRWTCPNCGYKYDNESAAVGTNHGMECLMCYGGGMP